MFKKSKIALTFLSIAFLLASGLPITSVSAASANLVVAATAISNPLAPGATAESIFSVANTGTAPSLAGTVMLSIPRAATGITRVITYKVSCSTFTPRYGNTQATCSIPALAPGASLDVMSYKATGPATVPAAGVSTSVGIVGPTNTVSALWQWKTQGLAELTATIAAVPNVVLVGHTATAYATIQNTGYTAAKNFNTHISVPGTVTAITPAGVCASTGGEIDCVTNIPNGSSGTFTVTYTATNIPAVYQMSIAADTTNSIPETNETNNVAMSSNVDVTDQYVALRTAVVNPAEATRGTTFTRAITVTNTGSIPALNVSFRDAQTTTTFVSATGPSGSSCAPTYSVLRFNNKVYSGVGCFIPSIPAGASATMNIVLSVPAGTGASTAVTDSVTNVVTTSLIDPLVDTTSQGTVLLVSPTGAVAPTNTVAPVVTGVAKSGFVLTSTNGTWIGTAPFTYAVNWQKCDVLGACADITGATGPTYVVQNADMGSTLRSAVVATNAGGSARTTSIVTALVPFPPVNTVAPVVSNNPIVGTLMTADAGVWTGTPNITYSYQWQLCDSVGAACSNIFYATVADYYPQDSDVGSTLRVAVTATNGAGATAAYSLASSVVAPGAPINTLSPALDVTNGTYVDSVLSVSNGNWLSTDVLNYSYQWQQCDVGNYCYDIPGATDATYTLTETDVSFAIQAVVTASNSLGSTSTVSDQTVPVTLSAPIVPVSSIFPANTSAPALVPALHKQVRYTWGITPGTWEGTPLITYQWQRCSVDTGICTDIPGATNTTYTLQTADLLNSVSVIVTGTNSLGSSTAVSNSTGEVDPYEIP